MATVITTAIPNQGYKFVSWNDGKSNPRTDITTSTANNSTFTAFFSNKYALKYMVEPVATAGSITGTNTQIVDKYGNGTQVTATPGSGYHFVCWSDGVKTASRTDTDVSQDIYVYAIFAQTYRRTYIANIGGKVSSNNTDTNRYDSMSGLFAIGDTATAYAVPDSGYTFTSWSDGITTQARSDIITVTSSTPHDTAIVALFSNTHNIIYVTGDGGQISTSPAFATNGGGIVQSR
jgi:hypothetical protein